MEAHHVHPALGQEPSVMFQLLRRAIALDVGVDSPEPDRRPVAQDEGLTIVAEPYESALAGDLLVHGA